jgi:hypothetical protein
MSNTQKNLKEFIDTGEITIDEKTIKKLRAFGIEQL